MDMRYYIYSISSMSSIIKSICEGIYYAVIKLLKFMHPRACGCRNFGLEGTCQVAIYKMTNGSKKHSSWPSHIQGSVEQWLNGNSQSMSASRMANGDGKWINQFCEKQCHVWCFYKTSHISSTLLNAYLQKWFLLAHVCSNLSTCGKFCFAHSQLFV